MNDDIAHGAAEAHRAEAEQGRETIWRTTAAGVLGGDSSMVFDGEQLSKLLSVHATAEGVSVKVVWGWRRYWLPASQVCEIGAYSGPLGSGIRIRHSVERIPSLIAVLADFSSAAPALRALGYRVVEDAVE